MQGHDNAQIGLGMSYLKGWGVPVDLRMAHMWLCWLLFHTETAKLEVISVQHLKIK